MFCFLWKENIHKALNDIVKDDTKARVKKCFSKVGSCSTADVEPSECVGNSNDCLKKDGCCCVLGG
jgi:hypothetical protein